MTAVILGIARIAGETAPVLFNAGGLGRTTGIRSPASRTISHSASTRTSSNPAPSSTERLGCIVRAGVLVLILFVIARLLGRSAPGQRRILALGEETQEHRRRPTQRTAAPATRRPHRQHKDETYEPTGTWPTPSHPGRIDNHATLPRTQRPDRRTTRRLAPLRRRTSPWCRSPLAVSSTAWAATVHRPRRQRRCHLRPAPSPAIRRPPPAWPTTASTSSTTSTTSTTSSAVPSGPVGSDSLTSTQLNGAGSHSRPRRSRTSPTRSVGIALQPQRQLLQLQFGRRALRVHQPDHRLRGQ